MGDEKMPDLPKGGRYFSAPFTPIPAPEILDRENEKRDDQLDRCAEEAQQQNCQADEMLAGNDDMQSSSGGSPTPSELESALLGDDDSEEDLTQELMKMTVNHAQVVLS